MWSKPAGNEQKMISQIVQVTPNPLFSFIVTHFLAISFLTWEGGGGHKSKFAFFIISQPLTTNFKKN
jgi:hypothetical protein